MIKKWLRADKWVTLRQLTWFSRWRQWLCELKLRTKLERPKAIPGFLSYLQPHLLLSPLCVSPTFLLGGKALWKETVRPPGCLLGTDAHHNLKKKMPLVVTDLESLGGQRQLWWAEQHPRVYGRGSGTEGQERPAPRTGTTEREGNIFGSSAHCPKPSQHTDGISCGQGSTERATRGLRNCC